MCRSLDLQILPVLMKDLKDILDIEQHVFPDPWSKGMFFQELIHPDSSSLKAVVNQVLVGYAFLRRFIDEWALLNLAVVERWRRRGVATCLLNHILHVAQKEGFTRITLEVNEKNPAAIALYQKFGFQTIGRRPRYYQYNQADALVMELVLAQTG